MNKLIFHLNQAGKKILSPDEQFNEYLYMFNKYSSIKVKNRQNYYSNFKQLVDITLTVAYKLLTYINSVILLDG